MKCRDWIADQGRRRHGRFIFYRRVHCALLRSGGTYHFAVYKHKRDNLISEKVISAREIENLFGLSQVRQKAIPWITVFAKAAGK